MKWQPIIRDYSHYLRIEKGLSDNTLENYLRDVERMREFFEQQKKILSPLAVETEGLRDFIHFLSEDCFLNERSIARNISSMNSLFGYLLREDYIKSDPTELLDYPRLSRKLPEVLSVAEIDSMFEKIDHSTPQGTRNRAMLELLYSCGLRVSELVNLTFSQLFLEDGFIRAFGKGSKERLVPIGSSAIKYLGIYMDHIRKPIQVTGKDEEIIFLNRRGGRLSRVYVFQEIKKQYIDKGKVYFSFVQYPLLKNEERAGLAAATLCAEDQKKFFKYQSHIFNPKIKRNFASAGQFAKDTGLNSKKFESCLKTPAAMSRIDKNIAVAKEMGINGTPTFFINGEKLIGAGPFENYAKIIDKHLSTKSKN